MKAKYFDKKASEVEKGFELDNSVFGVKVNESLLNQYVYTYLSNQRQSNATTLDRGEVRGGGKKPWNQKGTGRARAGSIRSPLWKGGGVTFGPSNEKNYKKDMTKKMVKESIKSALSKLAADNKVVVISSEVATEVSKSKDAMSYLEKVGFEKGVTVVQKGASEVFVKSLTNLKNVNVLAVEELNTYDVLKSRNLFVFDSAVDFIVDRWGKK